MAKKPDVIVSNWYHYFEGLQESPQNFYTQLEQTIKGRELPNCKLSRVDYREGGVFSAKREYFRVQGKEHIFDICAAPYAKGFFFSWWMGKSLGWFWRIMLKIPFLGVLLMALFRPETYYQADTMMMFQESIRMAFNEAVDATTNAKGVRALSEEEKKPIMSDFFKKFSK